MRAGWEGPAAQDEGADGPREDALEQTAGAAGAVLGLARVGRMDPGGSGAGDGPGRAAVEGAQGLPTAGTGRDTPGLERLYRQAVQAVRPGAPALPPEGAVRTIRAQEPEGAAASAVDELDRAVRRDSRRYDGGMSIF